MRQKYRSRLGTQLDEMPGPIVLFVLAGAFVLFDHAAVVLRERIARRDAGLAVAVRVQMVEIQRRRSLVRERRVALQRAISFGSGAIDDVVMGIRVRGQVDLGPRDVQKAERIAARKGTRFVGVDHVVGNGGDARRGGRIGADSTEGSDDSHREPSII